MISRFLRQPGLSAFYASCLLIAFVGAVLAQQASEKLVAVIQAEQITDAVMISNVAVAGKPVECGLFIKPPVVIQPVTPFQAGGDWLQQMAITLVNRTNKNIVFGGIALYFLDTGDCKSLPCVETSLAFGKMPAIDAYDGRTGQPFNAEHPERPPIDWKPEQTIVVHVSDYMDEIASRLSNSPNQLAVTAITKVNVYREAFFFDDGMRWEGGRFSVPDPERPGRFRYLPADYFPGKRGHNWPPGYNN